MTEAPIDIRRFETLQLAYVFMSLIYGFVVAPTGLFIRVSGAVLTLMLSMLVSRGRKNWARWTLLGLFVLWIVLLALALSMAFTDRIALPVIPPGAPFAIGVAALLQVTALYLAFTPQPSAWLRRAPSQA
jgi:hypothetical protein